MEVGLPFQAFEQTLRAALTRPLPGATAHLALAPRPSRPGWRPGSYPPEARRAAGLLLLYPSRNRPHLVLTVRAPDLPHHSGQVSFPGGAIDPDETIEHAALREAQEEIGLDPALVRIVGRLSPLHIPVSGFVLFPVVAVSAVRPPLRPASREVARLLEVPVAELIDPAALRTAREMLADGTTRVIPYFAVQGEKVWGATAMILSELLMLLGHPVTPDTAGA